MISLSTSDLLRFLATNGDFVVLLSVSTEASSMRKSVRAKRLTAWCVSPCPSSLSESKVAKELGAVYAGYITFLAHPR